MSHTASLVLVAQGGVDGADEPEHASVSGGDVSIFVRSSNDRVMTGAESLAERQ